MGSDGVSCPRVRGQLFQAGIRIALLASFLMAILGGSAFAYELTLDIPDSSACIGNFTDANPCSLALDNDSSTRSETNGTDYAYVFENYTVNGSELNLFWQFRHVALNYNGVGLSKDTFYIYYFNYSNSSFQLLWTPSNTGGNFFDTIEVPTDGWLDNNTAQMMTLMRTGLNPVWYYEGRMLFYFPDAPSPEPENLSETTVGGLLISSGAGLANLLTSITEPLVGLLIGLGMVGMIVIIIFAIAAVFYLTFGHPADSIRAG